MLELGTIYTSKDIGCFMYWYINAFSLKFVFFKPPCETKTCIEFKKINFWHHIMAKGTYSSHKFLSQMKKVVNRPTLMFIISIWSFCYSYQYKFSSSSKTDQLDTKWLSETIDFYALEIDICHVLLNTV